MYKIIKQNNTMENVTSYVSKSYSNADHVAEIFARETLYSI